jgi:hypothetical protein
MKITNTFIVKADDSATTTGIVPKIKDGKPSVARMHYELLTAHPYAYDLDSFNFEIWCRRNDIDEADRESHRETFFSKGHPCMRASPLTKTHGFGAHYDNAGKIAIYPVESTAYRKLLNDPDNKIEMAMRTKRPVSA